MSLERKLRILIIDDQAKDSSVCESKGYDQIEQWFPGVFDVDRSRTFNDASFDDIAAEAAIIKICETKYDLILLDYNFSDVIPLSDWAPDVLRYIREDDLENLKEYVEGLEQGNLNQDTYIIGVSTSWNNQNGGLLNGYTGQGRTNPEGLKEEIKNYMSSRNL
jgi:hypothetical protein